MAQIECEVCIIGAGSAGLSVAAGLSQLGLRTVLIEHREMGGECLNTGCVPSKALLAAGKAAHHDGAAEFPGISNGGGRRRRLCSGEVGPGRSHRHHRAQGLGAVASKVSACRC